MEQFHRPNNDLNTTTAAAVATSVHTHGFQKEGYSPNYSTVCTFSENSSDNFQHRHYSQLSSQEECPPSYSLPITSSPQTKNGRRAAELKSQSQAQNNDNENHHHHSPPESPVDPPDSNAILFSDSEFDLITDAGSRKSSNSFMSRVVGCRLASLLTSPKEDPQQSQAIPFPSSASRYGRDFSSSVDQTLPHEDVPWSDRDVITAAIISTPETAQSSHSLSSSLSPGSSSLPSESSEFPANTSLLRSPDRRGLTMDRGEDVVCTQASSLYQFSTTTTSFPTPAVQSDSQYTKMPVLSDEHRNLSDNGSANSIKQNFNCDKETDITLTKSATDDSYFDKVQKQTPTYVCVNSKKTFNSQDNSDISNGQAPSLNPSDPTMNFEQTVTGERNPKSRHLVPVVLSSPLRISPGRGQVNNSHGQTTQEATSSLQAECSESPDSDVFSEEGIFVNMTDDLERIYLEHTDQSATFSEVSDDQSLSVDSMFLSPDEDELEDHDNDDDQLTPKMTSPTPMTDMLVPPTSLQQQRNHNCKIEPSEEQEEPESDQQQQQHENQNHEETLQSEQHSNEEQDQQQPPDDHQQSLQSQLQQRPSEEQTEGESTQQQQGQQRQIEQQQMQQRQETPDKMTMEEALSRAASDLSKMSMLMYPDLVNSDSPSCSNAHSSSDNRLHRQNAAGRHFSPIFQMSPNNQSPSLDQPESPIYEDHEFNFNKKGLRKSSSLKTNKTPPGTPHRKKAVRFADAMGLDLESVRHVLNMESPPRIPASAMADLKQGLSEDHKEVGVRFLAACFTQPGSTDGFRNRVVNKKVCLENAIVTDLTITGFVRVANLAFHKSVRVRYTHNGWGTFHDIAANYVQNSCDGPTDRFSFSIIAPAYFVAGSRLEFAVSFCADGVEYWDNNEGSNYVFECFAKAVPLDNDPAWMHFL